MRKAVGEAVAARLYAVEAAIDNALGEAALLVADLPRARGQAYLAAVTGQQVFDGAAQAVTALTEARARIVATHNSLSALARKLGLDDLAVGPIDKPEDTPPTTGRVVSAVTQNA